MGSGRSAQYVAGEQIEAFRERAADVRKHPVFQRPRYSFDIQARPQVCGTGRSFTLPRPNRDQQFQLATLLQPLLAQEDMI